MQVLRTKKALLSASTLLALTNAPTHDVNCRLRKRSQEGGAEGGEEKKEEKPVSSTAARGAAVEKMRCYKRYFIVKCLWA